MACLQRARGLIDHATVTAADIDTSGIEESVAMARLHMAMGMIDNEIGDVNEIFGGDRDWLGGGGRHGK